MKFLMQSDYFSSEERIEYGGLYGITLPNLCIEELYTQIKDKKPIAIIDEKLLNYFI